MGLYIIRGENVEILGEIDLEKEAEGAADGGLTLVDARRFAELPGDKRG